MSAKYHTFCIHYQPNGIYDSTRLEDVVATSARSAYIQFMDKHGWRIYSAYVASVTYQNGNSRTLNTFSGKPY